MLQLSVLFLLLWRTKLCDHLIGIIQANSLALATGPGVGAYFEMGYRHDREMMSTDVGGLEQWDPLVDVDYIWLAMASVHQVCFVAVVVVKCMKLSRPVVMTGVYRVVLIHGDGDGVLNPWTARRGHIC